MSYYSIVNAAPVSYLLGIQELSGRQVPREPEAIPTHLPMTYFFGKKGHTGAVLAGGAERALIYDADSFDPLKKWHNHATALSNLMNAEGNVQMYQRVIPPDAGPEANLTLWADVSYQNVDDYERNSDGSIKLDPNTLNPVVKAGGQIAGAKVVFYVTSDTTTLQAQSFGARTVQPGTQTQTVPNPEYDPANPPATIPNPDYDPGDPQSGPATIPNPAHNPDAVSQTLTITSERIPLFDAKMGYVGSAGNDIGMRLWAPTETGNGAFDKRVMERARVYPIRMSVVERNPALGTSKPKETIFGEQTVLVTLKPDTINPVTTERLSIGDVFLQAYQNLDDPRYPAIFGEFGTLHVYQNNIDSLLAALTALEKDFYETLTSGELDDVPQDFLNDGGDDKYLFNFLTGHTHTGYPYHTYQIGSSSTSVRPGEFSNIMAAGSSDGTMNDATFAALVEEKMEDYLNPNSDVHNTALRVESIFYDSGFPLETKYALTNFIAVRKDTFLHLSTHEAGAGKLSAAADNALGVALRTRVQQFPESEYFGTAAVRCMIMGRSAKLRNSLYRERVSPVFEVGIKSARYMGASNGKWRAGRNFDGSPGSILDYLYDLSVSYTSATVRNRDWDTGINFVLDYDRRSLFFPALKTVYNDDTSVVTSYFTALCAVECNKVLDRAWRAHTGISGLSDELFAMRVDEFIRRNLEGRFDGRFIIETETYYTNADVLRGYSWHTRVKIYAPSMKTVQTGYIQTYRLSDYTAAQA